MLTDLCSCSVCSGCDVLRHISKCLYKSEFGYSGSKTHACCLRTRSIAAYIFFYKNVYYYYLKLVFSKIIINYYKCFGEYYNNILPLRRPQRTYEKVVTDHSRYTDHGTKTPNKTANINLLPAYKYCSSEVRSKGGVPMQHSSPSYFVPFANLLRR